MAVNLQSQPQLKVGQAHIGVRLAVIGSCMETETAYTKQGIKDHAASSDENN